MNRKTGWVPLLAACMVCAGMLAMQAPALAGGKKAKANPANAKITAKEAEKTALARYPDGKLAGKTELEKEDGKWQYAVMVKTGKKLLEVQVDANTGKILDTEETTPAEEANEKAKGKKAGKGEKPAK